MLFIVLGMFAIIAHSALGTKLEEFGTLYQSFESMLLFTVGEMTTFRKIPLVSPILGPLIFWYVLVHTPSRFPMSNTLGVNTGLTSPWFTYCC